MGSISLIEQVSRMQKRMLVVLAHPDDESFGMGGSLAKYAAEGVEVHVVIATDGAVGSVAEGFEDAREKLVEVRRVELERATAILGAQLHRLEYRDSGMRGDPGNDHPSAFIRCDDQAAIGRIVRLIREIRPQVVVTHDETGGYFHPDHIRCWQIVTAAFEQAGDPTRYPELNLPAFRPERLYYTAFSNRWVKLFVWIARLRRQDPTRFGRNHDIDLTKLGIPAARLHAHINFRRYWDVRNEASSAHASQGGGGGGRAGFVPEWLQKLLMATETFIRAYPPAPDGFRERDLFP